MSWRVGGASGGFTIQVDKHRDRALGFDRTDLGSSPGFDIS